MNYKNIYLFTILAIVIFCSCNSNGTSDTQKSSETGIPNRYLVAAQEFCNCHGEWLQLQYDGEIAKQNEDIAKMTKISEKLKNLPSRAACAQEIDAKMEQYEKEDGADLMEQHFDAAAKLHCPIFLQIMELAEQVEDMG